MALCELLGSFESDASGITNAGPFRKLAAALDSRLQEHVTQ